MGVVGAGVAKGWIDTGSFKRGVKTISESALKSAVMTPPQTSP